MANNYQVQIFRDGESGEVVLYFQDSLEGLDETFELSANGNCYHTHIVNGEEVTEHEELKHCLESFLDRVEARDSEEDDA
jgi:hypothetical protein